MSPASTEPLPPETGHELPVSEQIADWSPSVIRPPRPPTVRAPISATTIRTRPRYSSADCPRSRRQVIMCGSENFGGSPRSRGGSRNHARLCGRLSSTRMRTGSTSCVNPSGEPSARLPRPPTISQTWAATIPHRTSLPPVRRYQASSAQSTPGAEAYSTMPSTCAPMASAAIAEPERPIAPRAVAPTRTRSSTRTTARGPGRSRRGAAAGAGPPATGMPPTADIRDPTPGAHE
ncbi:hypothetical protein SMICM17S_11665 [Streptomyces microflavus]